MGQLLGLYRGCNGLCNIKHTGRSMVSRITMILPIENELLHDFGEYCRDHNVTVVEGITHLMKKATGHKTKRSKLKDTIANGTG